MIKTIACLPLLLCIILATPAAASDYYPDGTFEMGGELIRTLSTPDSGAAYLLYSPDGRTIAVAGGHQESNIRLFVTARPTEEPSS